MAPLNWQPCGAWWEILQLFVHKKDARVLATQCGLTGMAGRRPVKKKTYGDWNRRELGWALISLLISKVDGSAFLCQELMTLKFCASGTWEKNVPHACSVHVHVLVFIKGARCYHCCLYIGGNKAHTGEWLSLVTRVYMSALVLPHMVPLSLSLRAHILFPQRDSEQKRSSVGPQSPLSPLQRWTQWRIAPILELGPRKTISSSPNPQYCRIRPYLETES